MSESRRFLVTGSRTWVEAGSIVAALLEHTNPEDVMVVGDAKGADAIARAYWRAKQRQVEEFVITDERWRQLRRFAGLKRNMEMVDSGVDLCLAFVDLCRKCPNSIPPHATHGAAQCVGYAREKGVPVHLYGAGRVAL